jgi:phosphoserine phosphatase RsbU/P
LSDEVKVSILLVEDDPNISKLFKHNLTKAGYTCNTAMNGREGFEEALKLKPDLIISDIMMPEVDGFQFRQLLLEQNELKGIPFVFLTARGEEDDILQGYELGIEDYIIKTSSPKVVLAKVNAILKSLEKERGKVVGEVQKAADNMGAKVVPEECPVLEGFEIKQWHVPFMNIPGGDFIDYIKLDEDNTLVVLGDVMGKRWGAWYFAVAYAGYVRSAVRIVLESSSDNSPSEILRRVNSAIYSDERISEVFITLSIIVIDTKNSIIKYGGAGDLPLLLKKETVSTIKSDGLLLGFSKDSEYNDTEIKMNSGDEVIVLTDGIIESRGSEGVMFGLEGLSGVLEKTPTEINSMETIKSEFSKYVNNNYEDDVSMIVIKKL